MLCGYADDKMMKMIRQTAVSLEMYLNNIKYHLYRTASIADLNCMYKELVKTIDCKKFQDMMEISIVLLNESHLDLTSLTFLSHTIVLYYCHSLTRISTVM